VKHGPDVEKNTNAYRLLVRKFDRIGTACKNLGADDRTIF